MFCPERGLWHLSGYVLSKKGAQTLLGLLTYRGPVDLWINHKFREMDVRALRRSVINQRLDLHSTNSYSILPALSRIGVLDGDDAALFQQRPTHSPVFAFGAPGSGLSSLAMALSMLGYRCCSDFDRIPECELQSLLAARTDRVFDAYVNIESLRPHVRMLTQRYPRAKFIVIDDVAGTADRQGGGVLDEPEGADVLRLRSEGAKTWRALCEHVRLAPPGAPYPAVRDIGQRRHRSAPVDTLTARPAKRLRHDRSPWVVEPRAGWAGINASAFERLESSAASRVRFEDDLADIQSARWLLRNDTFPGNLGLFRPANVTPQPGASLRSSENSWPAASALRMHHPPRRRTAPPTTPCPPSGFEKCGLDARDLLLLGYERLFRVRPQHDRTTAQTGRSAAFRPLQPLSTAVPMRGGRKKHRNQLLS